MKKCACGNDIIDDNDECGECFRFHQSYPDGIDFDGIEDGNIVVIDTRTRRRVDITKDNE